jgi:outer membrane protein
MQRSLENRIAHDITTAFLNAGTAYERVALTAELVQQATLALDLAQARYNLGLSSIVELSQAQLNLTGAQIAGSSAKFDYELQRAVLDYQMGVVR